MNTRYDKTNEVNMATVEEQSSEVVSRMCELSGVAGEVVGKSVQVSVTLTEGGRAIWAMWCGGECVVQQSSFGDALAALARKIETAPSADIRQAELLEQKAAELRARAAIEERERTKRMAAAA